MKKLLPVTLVAVAALSITSAPAFAQETVKSPQGEIKVTSVKAPPGSTFTNNFVKKWKGKYVDVDGAYGAQCWDLAAQFSTELKYGQIKTGNGLARGIYENYGSNGNAAHYKRIANTETNFPVAGDIIVWNSNMGGGAGHVAIVIAADVKTVKVLEQNSPTGAATREFVYTNYSNVLGWLRPNVWA